MEDKNRAASVHGHAAETEDQTTGDDSGVCTTVGRQMRPIGRTMGNKQTERNWRSTRQEGWKSGQCVAQENETTRVATINSLSLPVYATAGFGELYCDRHIVIYLA